MVNDGNKEEMTCCPASDPDILSNVASEINVKRSGKCLSDELSTGIESGSGRSYCTKINTLLFELSPPVSSTYMGGGFGGILGQLAGAYHNSDLCTCPEGMVSIGGHSWANNTCGEKCVEVKKK